ncbi:MAG TPA: VWA domain-containing protein [Polyangia bacterium]|nr:VWA domain-containing protein [Polyangia bacterium]
MGIFPAWGLALEGLTTGAAVGLALAGVAILTGLYLLKPRRRRVVVAFAPLWLPGAGERRAERWARRLRRWLSLALQATVFCLLLLAAADPQPRAADRAGRSFVVLIDRSASMSATDEPGTRLGAARARARALVSGLGPADRALVASFAADVSAESGFETDPRRLARAVDALSPSEEPADLGRALFFAAAVLRGQPHPTLVLVSDGRFSEDARANAAALLARGPGGAAATPSLADVDVRWAPVGRRARNVALLAFAARRLPADPTSVDAALTVRNFGADAATVTLEISGGAAGAPVDRVHLSLAPGETRRHVLPDVAAPGACLVARLLEGDDLPLDDRAYATVPALERLRILRVGPPDLFLDGALLSLGETVAVHGARPEAAESTRARWSSYDVVIFDGVAPAPAPTTGHFLYLAPRGPGSPFPGRGVLRDPVFSDTRRGHPLLRQLDLADVNIAEAERLTLGAGDVAVASSFGAPLIAARERPGLRVAALAFDVRRSDLPMRAAFPLLVANALGWLAGSDARELPPALVGSVARVLAPRGATRVDVRDPAGARASWPVTGDVALVPIRRSGFYRVGDVTLAANAADAVESDTTPVRTLALGGRTLATPDPPLGHGRRPLATWALLVAAALLLLEWVTTHRRWTV